MDLTIDGIGTVPSNAAEYTSGAVLKKYLDNVAILKEIFAKRGTVANPGTLQASDYDDALIAMNNLKNLALNGVTDGNPPLTFYLTAEMGIDLDLLFKSLQAAGITINNPITNAADKVTLLGDWQSLAGFGVQAIVNAAASVSTNSTRTLQSMVELEYVKAGNDLISTKLSDLESSLQTTQGILDQMAIVQGISNQIAVTNRGDFAFPPKSDNQIPSTAVAGLQAAFNKIASGQPASPSSIFHEMRTFTAAYATDVATAQANALANNTSLSTELAKLTGASKIMNDILSFDWGSTASKGANAQSLIIQKYTQIYQIMASAQFRQVFPIAAPTDTAATELIAAKQKLYQDLVNLEKISSNNTRSVEGTLANFVYHVTLDISNAFKGIDMTTAAPQQLKSAVSVWILDNQNQKVSSTLANNTGQIQDRITQAITAAESLNNTEKQNVSDFQFMFQQFYTSASTVLQKVTQIIEKMAQKISQ